MTSFTLGTREYEEHLTKSPHNSILHYACSSLLKEDNDRNRKTPVGIIHASLFFFLLARPQD